MSQSLDGLAKTKDTSKILHLRNKFISLSDVDFDEKNRGEGYFLYKFLDSFEESDARFRDYRSSWVNNLTGENWYYRRVIRKSQGSIHFDAVQKVW